MNKSRILVVDDDANLSRLVSIMLEKTRLYEVKVENRSHNAFATAAAFKPDVILLDVDMPGLDGGDVAHLIRQDAALKSTPIVFFTSLISQAEAGGSMVSRGGENYLAKPVEPSALIRSLEALLSGPAAVSG
ncbi:MAG: response regulator [Chthoniobacterales bacterium]